MLIFISEVSLKKRSQSYAINIIVESDTSDTSDTLLI